MILRAGLWVGASLWLGLLAFVLVVMSSVSVKISAALLPALSLGALLVIRPFLALFLLVLFAQLDAIANIISDVLPLSFYKLLTAAAIGGYMLTALNKAPPDRLYPRGVVELRYAALFALSMLVSFLICDLRADGLDHMIGFLSVMVLFWLIVVMVDTPTRFEALVWTLVITGLIAGLITLLETLLGIRLVSQQSAAVLAQFEGQARSAGASDYNPTTAAHMLLATTTIAGVMFVCHPKFRLVSGLAFAIGVPALVFSLARSAAIAFVIVGLIFAWRNRHGRFFPLAAITVLSLIAIALPFVPAIFWERMATMTDFGLDRTLLRRVSYNLIGLDLWFAHPVLGVGPGNFPQHYASFDYRWYPGREPLPRQLHNSYLEVAVEMGLVGISTFLMVMVSSLKRGIEAARGASRAISPLALAVAFGFGAFLVASAFMPNEDTKFMWILPALCVAGWRLMRNPPDF